MGELEYWIADRRESLENVQCLPPVARSLSDVCFGVCIIYY